MKIAGYREGGSYERGFRKVVWYSDKEHELWSQTDFKS